MVDLAQIQAAYYMVAATGVLAAIYYIFNMKATLQTRQAQLFMQIYSKFDDREFTRNQLQIQFDQYKDYDEWLQRYGSENKMEAYSAWILVARFFHGVGVLVDKGLVSGRLVYDLMGDPVIDAWEKMGPVTWFSESGVGRLGMGLRLRACTGV